MGFGRLIVSGRRRDPSPPAITTAFIDDLAFDVSVFMHGISIAWGSAANQKQRLRTEKRERRIENRELRIGD
jgi:hypothetical protein